MAGGGGEAEMSADTARGLFEQGATLVFLHVPRGTQFGIDCNSWTVDTNFKGVKMIPPGIHFVYYSAVSKQQEVAPRTGFFHNFRQREVLVKKWDPSTEDICTEPVSAEEQERIESNKQEMDKYLGAYPYDSYKQWVSLSGHVTEGVLERLQPISGKISSVTELQSHSSTTQSRAEHAQTAHPEDADPDDPRLPRMHRAPESVIRFTDIPRKKYPEGASPADITRYSMDHSYVLQTLLEGVYAGDELGVLGELQFAFLCFLLGQVFEAFEQWKQLVHLLCSCEQALCAHPALYTQFISIMHYHVREIPQDFFVDIVTRNNFLVTTLRTFFATLESSECKQELKSRGARFRKHLEKRFSWDFGDDQEDDDQPVVVQLPADQDDQPVVVLLSGDVGDDDQPMVVQLP